MKKITVEVSLPIVVELDASQFYIALGNDILDKEDFSQIIAQSIIAAQPFTNFVKETNENDPSLKIISAG